MFRTRTLFSRLFRLRKRRPAKADSGSANIARASSSLSEPPPPPPPPKQHGPVSLYPEVIHIATTPSTRRPHSLCPTSHPSPVAPPPLPTSASTSPSPSLSVPPPCVIRIEHREDEPIVTFPPPPAHAPPSDVGARRAPANVHSTPRLAPSLLSASKLPHAHHVSFQLPPEAATTVVDADADADEDAGSDVDSDTDARASATSSTCSTLVGAHPHAHALAKGEGETTGPALVPTDPPPAYAYSAPVSTPSSPVSPSTSTSTPAKARHMSLFQPQPVRKDVARFSMPARPTAGTGTGTRDGRRESKRTSAMMPLTSGSGMSKREKRTTRWSRELNKPATQEVLMALRGA